MSSTASGRRRMLPEDKPGTAPRNPARREGATVAGERPEGLGPGPVRPSLPPASRRRRSPPAQRRSDPRPQRRKPHDRPDQQQVDADVRVGASDEHQPLPARVREPRQRRDPESVRPARSARPCRFRSQPQRRMRGGDGQDVLRLPDEPAGQPFDHRRTPAEERAPAALRGLSRRRRPLPESRSARCRPGSCRDPLPWSRGTPRCRPPGSSRRRSPCPCRSRSSACVRRAA